MTRALVTGAAGFVGGHLVASLTADGLEVWGTSITGEGGFAAADLRSATTVEAAVVSARPDWVFHLAAQSSASLSWKRPDLTYEVNVTGTHYLLDAVRRHAPKARVLVTCTSDQYGFVDPQDCPLDELVPQRPLSPYAASKMAQEAVARMFHEAFGLSVIVTRAFMHIGPGQPPSFATADWARQLALIEAGSREPVVEVGNLDVAREYGDVRDIVRAYRLAIEKGEPGETYNVATGEARPLRDVLGMLIDLADIDVDVRVDPAKVRPADPQLLEGDATKLRSATGWEPTHHLRDTVPEVLDYWRVRVAGATIS
jgi:GDP-4-dehydro-6-deoxy-D-mannose reductase